MWRLPRLQLVFWLSTMGGIVAFLITTIASDFGYILSFCFFLTTFARGCDWSGISSSCSGATILRLALSVLLFLMSPFFFLLSFFLDLLGFGPLFDLIGLIMALSLGGHVWFFLRLFKLVAKVDTHLQRFFSPVTPLIQVGIFMNTSFNLIPIGFAN